MTDSKESHHAAYDRFIPGHVDQLDLNYRQKYLYSVIRSLTVKEGFCWATNQYLADIMKVSERQMKRDVALLVEFGVLHREVIQEGLSKKRKLWLSEAYAQSVKKIQKSYNRDTDVPIDRDTHVPSDRDTGGPYNSKRSNSKKKERKDKKKEKSPSAPISKKLPKLKFGEMVELTQAQYDQLVATHSKQIVDDIIDDINNYCISHNAPYENYLGAFNTFLKKRKSSKLEIVTPSPSEGPITDKARNQHAFLEMRGGKYGFKLRQFEVTRDIIYDPKTGKKLPFDTDRAQFEQALNRMVLS